MPTPSPIIVARVGDTVAKVVAAASRPSRASPQTTQTRAVTSGSRAATRLPKPISSTTTATPKPMASLMRSFAAGRASSPSEPPYSTSAPAARSGCTAESTPSRYPDPRVEGCSLNRTVRYAVLPSPESGPTSGPLVLLWAVRGFWTDSTSGSFWRLSTTVDIWLLSPVSDASASCTTTWLL